MKKKTKVFQTELTRRQFLGCVGLSTGSFMIVPGSVLGLRGATPPSGKLNLAGIGIGGQGASDLSQMESENIVALCDVDQNHGAHVFKKYSLAKQFTDNSRDAIADRKYAGDNAGVLERAGTDEQGEYNEQYDALKARFIKLLEFRLERRLLRQAARLA